MSKAKIPKTTMPFPNAYKVALLAKDKNMTIRIGDETGKYKVGKTYEAESYNGARWKIKIKVVKVIQTKISNLPGYKIPKQEIENVKKTAVANDLPDDVRADIVHFKII